jgi:hypothetical protein
MTEYAVLLLGDAERWWDMTEEERRAGYAQHDTFSQQVHERGHRITGGAELRRASEARTIAPGTTTVTDGPWAETREQVGGFYIIDSDDLDDLLDCCRLLAATGDAVEVRRCVSAEERPA